MLSRVNYRDYDCRRAVSYIIYMMAGSIFNKCICQSMMAERRNYMHFADMPEAKDEFFGDSVLRTIDGLSREFLEAAAGLNCEVSFLMDGDRYRVYFLTGGFEEIEAVVERDGRFEITALPACRSSCLCIREGEILILWLADGMQSIT